MPAKFVTLLLLVGSVALAEGDADVDRDAWQPAISAVFEQLDMLELFALTTRVGGMTVNIPRELRGVPMRMIEEADVLRDRGIEIDVKELRFRNLGFIYDKSPEWREDRPLVPTTITFDTLGIGAEAKTRVGTIPLGATFRNGQLPVNFLPQLDERFDLGLMPEERAEDTRLDDVQIEAGGRLASGIANRLLSDRVGQLLLEHGVGQTLQLSKGDLISGDAALRLLDIPSESRRGRALDTLLDRVGR